jgi:hypothetical protein
MIQKEKAPHILNTSSNLLGLCFVVFTTVKALKIQENTLVDDLASICVLLFMASSVLSFLSIRSKTNRAIQYEKIADFIFLAGLIVMFLTTLFITLKIIR